MIWIFKLDVQGQPKVPLALATPLILIVVGLFLDLLQYAVATSIWGIFHRSKETAGTAEDVEFQAPRQFNWPAIALFTLKVVAILSAYAYLVRYLSSILL